MKEYARILSRGKSIEYSKWKPLTQYSNDFYKQDMVSHGNSMFVCKQSHMSTTENEPVATYNETTGQYSIVGTATEYWDLMFTFPTMGMLIEVEKHLIDLIEEVDSKRYTEITTRELRALRDNGELVPGKQYRITDYLPLFTVGNTTMSGSAGHRFDILVTATSESSLSEEAKALHHKGDEYFKDCNLNAWKIWYTLDGGKWDMCANIDRWLLPELRVKYKELLEDEYSEVGGAIYWLCPRKTENSLYLLEVYEGNLDSGDSLKYLGTETLDGEVCDMWLRESAGVDNSYIYTECIVENGTIPEDLLISESGGFIYRMIDEYGNDCPYDFKNFVHNESEYTFGIYNDDSLIGKCSGNRILTWCGNILVYGSNNIIHSYNSDAFVSGNNQIIWNNTPIFVE